MKLKETWSAFKHRQIFLIVLSLLIFSPLLFMNIRQVHDWGDDFAQYLAQADNLIHGREMAATGYIYNPEYPSLGPAAYPPGFPLLIAPLVGIFGNEVKPYNYFTGIILIFTALLAVIYLRRFTGWPAALAIAAALYYNPYVIGLKTEIMADIPFSLLFIAFVLLVQTDSKHWNTGVSVLIGLLAGVAIAVKSIGIVLPVSIVVFSLRELYISLKRGTAFRQALIELKNPAIAVVLALVLSFGIKFVFIRGAGGGGYLNIFDISMISEAVAFNIYVYSEVIRNFFINADSPLFWIGFPLGAMVLAFFVTGFIKSIFSKPEIADWVCLLYITVLLIYPYHNSGFRFLLPLAPIILAYSLKSAHEHGSFRVVASVATGAGVIILITYLKIIPGYVIPEKEEPDGPYAAHVASAFSEISRVTTEESRIVFIKPRALARFTGRSSMSADPRSTAAEVFEQLQPLQPTHYLLYTGLSDPALEHYLMTNRDEIRMVWRDEFFRLFTKIE